MVEGGKLRGIVSIGDVVKHRLDELELEANVLREAYISPPCVELARFDSAERPIGTLSDSGSRARTC